jgi:UDP-N-acetyl-D-glucosamine dehydrogenase
MEDLVDRGADVSYFDPWIPMIPVTRRHPSLAGRRRVAWEPEKFASAFDAALIVTDHDAVNYHELVGSVDLVVDTRNATRAVERERSRIVLA